MKKYLSIICVLLTLTAFASCGDSTSSSDSSKVTESSISETTTYKETEPETSAEKDDFITVPDLYGMDYDEAVEKYRDFFVILSNGREESELKQKSIISQDIEAGTTYESDGSRPRIRVKLSNGKKTKENKNTDTKLMETCKMGEISFKIPDNCEVTDNEDSIIVNFSDSSIIQFATMEATKEICSSADSDKEVLLDAILTSFISSGNFEATSEYSKTDVKGFFAITQEATYLSLYDCTLYCFFSENNAYILTFAKSQLLEAEEAYDLQHEIINSFEFESSDTELITTEKVTEPSIVETTNSFEPFTISGTGSTVIKDVNIPAEFVVYSTTHNGTSNFIAHFYDCNDKREPLVNEIGNYSCTQILNATYIDDSSSGMVEVNADGDWSITFSPVKAVVSNETSTSFSGYGANITGAFKSTGNMICTVSHDGSSNFIVHAYELSEDGDKQPVANEIGEYNGQCVIRTKKDTLYFFCVDADGNWTIDVE